MELEKWVSQVLGKSPRQRDKQVQIPKPEPEQSWCV